MSEYTKNKFMNNAEFWEGDINNDEIVKAEKYIPRYQLIFSEYSPLMALDQGFQIDKNSELKRRLFITAWKFYYIIQTNLNDLMDEFNIDKTWPNIREINSECKKYFMEDCYLRLIEKKGEITKLKNCWYEKEDWYKERQ